MDQEIKLTREYIKLDALLKVAEVADSGGQAKTIIQDELVRVNGQTETRRGRKLRGGDLVEVGGDFRVRIKVKADASS